MLIYVTVFCNAFHAHSIYAFIPTRTWKIEKATNILHVCLFYPYPFLSLPLERANTHCYHCGATGQKRKKSLQILQTFLPFSGPLTSKKSTDVVSQQRSIRCPSICAPACRFLSASSPIQQPPYSWHLHIFNMQKGKCGCDLHRGKNAILCPPQRSLRLVVIHIVWLLHLMRTTNLCF